MNTTNTLVSSTAMKTPAMADFTSMQSFALVAYTSLVTNVCLLYAQYLPDVSKAIVKSKYLLHA